MTFQISKLTIALVFSLGCTDLALAHQEEDFSMSDVSLNSCPLSFEVANLCASLTWTQGPLVRKMSEFTLQFWNADDNDMTPVELPFDLFIYLWAPSMGHGSGPVAIERLNPGSYKVTEVFFSMAGSWEIFIQFKSADKTIDEAKANIDL